MKQISIASLALVLLLSAGGLASASDAAPADRIKVQSCIERVRDDSSSAGSGPEASRDACIGTVAGPCLKSEEGQSTLGMVECYGRELAVWDGMLNDNYQALKDAIPPGAFRSLRDIQVKWIAYRDGKCGWPAVYFEGGSIARPIAAACLNETTGRRASELADYLDWTKN